MSAQEREDSPGKKRTMQNRSVSSPQESKACACVRFKARRLRAALSTAVSKTLISAAPGAPSSGLPLAVSACASRWLRRQTNLLRQLLRLLSAGPRSPQGIVGKPGSLNTQGLSTSDAPTSIVMLSSLLREEISLCRKIFQESPSVSSLGEEELLL